MEVTGQVPEDGNIREYMYVYIPRNRLEIVGNISDVNVGIRVRDIENETQVFFVLHKYHKHYSLHEHAQRKTHSRRTLFRNVYLTRSTLVYVSQDRTFLLSEVYVYCTGMLMCPAKSVPVFGEA
jgi:hypothetical protein